MGRTGGYLETLSWWHGRDYFSLRYSASVFGTPQEASSAYVDALDSLWLSARPWTLNGYEGQIFRAQERDGHYDVTVVATQGSIELEWMLRYTQAVRSTAEAEHLLALFVSLTNSRAQKAAATLPPVTSAPAPFVPYIAPMGTGPVIKSPSLMTLDSTLLPAGATVDAGATRTAQSPIEKRVTRHAALWPAGGLTYYVRTAQDMGESLIAITTLYASTAVATAAMQQFTGDNARPGMHANAPAPFNETLMQNTELLSWRGLGVQVEALRTDNVIMVLASTTPAVLLDTLPNALVQTVPTWLHASGIQVEDARGNVVRLEGLNWYGAESPDFVVGGLDFRSYQNILATIRQSGYNTIRLPISNQLVEQNPIVTQHVAANPELSGLHALDILDRIISYAGAIGLSVILDDHRSEAGWSSEAGGLWYTSDYPDSAFMHDWSTVAARYAATNAVIGADLRNEPHGAARWGNGDPTTDWLAAAERAGDAALAADPHLLIIVEGVQFYGSDPSYWWGGNLMGVATAPVALHLADGTDAHGQLVYSAHDYGPDNCGTGCPWFNSTTSYTSLSTLWEQHWGFITSDPTKPYAAPVWVGEFGTCNTGPQCGTDTTPGSQGQWFSSIIQYLQQKNLGWAYWSVNGSQSSGTTRVYGALDWYGYLTKDWTATYPWLATELNSIQLSPAPAPSPTPTPTPAVPGQPQTENAPTH